ncbi:flagellar biosynthesis protein FlhF [Marinobacter caseinilyticus]|uniref:flagellar biosynthesis protein FlhF n=1 Tax=Marinobacter caseinilyticus TaxID=2692195 RepID=UPI001407A856|nr:flagellar biosynthesis protein FlhF [Marinobacter caseinilyticus]
MKVKRFFASSMAEALKRVREDMGADAVILSNRRVDGGVEIVTALDYDENLARQRLGNAAAQATNGSRLAELQADQHRRLEDELGRSRNRIRDVREQRAAEGRQAQPAAITAQPAPMSAEHAFDGGSQAALAEMRAEISSLRDLFNTRSPEVNTPKPELPGASQQRLVERLEEFGLSRTLATALSRNNGKGRLDEGWKKALKTLASGIKTNRTEWPDEGGVFALVGPTGSGKTTTIGKMAARHVLRHGADSLALVTTDRYRVAAHEQLFVFGRILNVPVRVVDESHSLDAILGELTDRHLVLIDTAGLTQSDKGYQEQLIELAESRHRIQSHLVVSATSQPRIMKSMWHCYKMAKLAGCLITKVDEALTLGEALGFVVETGLPLAYYTDGQKVPQDLHSAESIPLVRLAVEKLKVVQRELALAEGA